MKILVCVKQVPGSNNVEVDPVTGVLKRSGIPSKCNPYDLYGIETALSLAERFGGTVESLTMGPPQAKEVIRETICMGTAVIYGLGSCQQNRVAPQGVSRSGDQHLITGIEQGQQGEGYHLADTVALRT